MVLTARTPEDVLRLIETVGPMGIVGTRPVGDRDNNAGTIEIASNPYSALGERVTNGIDALLELLAALAGYHSIEDWPAAPATPRDAARLLLKVPKAGLGDLTDK